MFFCPNCNNSYDISKTIPDQFGGQFDSESFDDSTIDSLSNTSELPSISEDVKVDADADVDSLSGGAVTIIDKILNEELTEKDIAQMNVQHFFNSSEYKKLNGKDKELVYNKIQDSLPQNKKKIQEQLTKNTDEESNTFFVCNNCKYTEKIKSGTKIFTRTADNISKTYAVSDYSDMINSDILPRTRRYICPNKKCPSQKDITKREAIFFRLNNSFRIKYICTACKEQF